MNRVVRINKLYANRSIVKIIFVLGEMRNYDDTIFYQLNTLDFCFNNLVIFYCDGMKVMIVQLLYP